MTVLPALNHAIQHIPSSVWNTLVPQVVKKTLAKPETQALPSPSPHLTSAKSQLCEQQYKNERQAILFLGVT